MHCSLDWEVGSQWCWKIGQMALQLQEIAWNSYIYCKVCQDDFASNGVHQVTFSQGTYYLAMFVCCRYLSSPNTSGRFSSQSLAWRKIRILVGETRCDSGDGCCRRHPWCSPMPSPVFDQVLGTWGDWGHSFWCCWALFHRASAVHWRPSCIQVDQNVGAKVGGDEKLL